MECFSEKGIEKTNTTALIISEQIWMKNIKRDGFQRLENLYKMKAIFEQLKNYPYKTIKKESLHTTFPFKKNWAYSNRITINKINTDGNLSVAIRGVGQWGYKDSICS